MHYAGILGKNHTLSRYELTSAGATIIDQQGLIVFFDSKRNHHRAGMTKWGRVVTNQELHAYLLEKQPKLIGSDNKNLALKRKRQYDFIKRIKVIEPIKTDRDIKSSGLEIITLSRERYLLVDHYQNIPLYESIDIHKPSSGMQIGMMPAKLTHLLTNIAVFSHGGGMTDEEITVRDPFTGFGTTNMIANACGYNTIGSDLNITEAKRNIDRWEDQSWATIKKITLRKHDVTKEFSPFFGHANVIVSEGRLGPIVSHKTRPDAINSNIKKIVSLYTIFFKNISKMGPNAPSMIVITIPEYSEYDDVQPYDLLIQHIPGLHTLDEVYRRRGQRVGRRVILSQNGKIIG